MRKVCLLILLIWPLCIPADAFSEDDNSAGVLGKPIIKSAQPENRIDAKVIGPGESVTVDLLHGVEKKSQYDRDPRSGMFTGHDFNRELSDKMDQMEKELKDLRSRVNSLEEKVR